MPKFKDAYQTTLGSRYDTDVIAKSIKESLIRDDLLAASLDVKKLRSVYPVFLTGFYSSEEKIPLFTHPILISDKDKQILAIDVRMMLKKNAYKGNLTTLEDSISNRADFNLARSRLILNLEWIESNVESLKSSLFLSTSIFCRVIADILAKSYALDPYDQICIAIASCYYYQALFTELDTIDADMLQKWKIHTAKATNADTKLIDLVFDKLEGFKVTGINSLSEVIKLSTDNIRLKDLNSVAILTLIKNVWYGTNSKEIIVAALEHPPTWMAVCAEAITNRAFRSSLIFKVAERIGKRGILEEYQNEVRKIMKEYQIGESHRLLMENGLL